MKIVWLFPSLRDPSATQLVLLYLTFSDPLATTDTTFPHSALPAYVTAPTDVATNTGLAYTV